MDKKIGKNIQVLFLLLVSFFGSLCCAPPAVTVSVLDTEHNPIRQVEAGVPFIVQVVVSDIQGPQLPETIQGFDNFKVTQHGSSHSVRMVNGVTTEQKIFNYIVRTDKKGVYKIGPVTCKGKNNTVAVSDTISIEVGDRVVADNVRKQQYFLQVELPKKTIYIGEKTNLTIRFYYKDTFDSLKIVHQDFENFYVDTVSEQAVDGEEKIQDVDYKYKEWTMTMYPEVVGLQLISQMQAVFKVSSTHMFDLFSFSNERIVQSAPRSIEVRQLPESKEYQDVSAVGKFDKAKFSLQHDTGDLGQGIVATYTVRGEGNFSYMKAPKLQLPAGLHYYESNSSIKKLGTNKCEKTFEYIIQGDRVGNYEIQPQMFVYFDPQKEEYKIVHTNKSALTIVGDIVKKQLEDTDNTQDGHNAEIKKQYVFKDGQINFVKENGFSTEKTSDGFAQQVLAWLLQALMGIAFLAAVYWVYLLKFFRATTQSYWILYLYAIVMTYRAYYQKNSKALYELLQTVCSRYGFDAIQGKELKAVIEKHSQKDVQSWEIFVHDMITIMYSGQEVSPEIKQKNLDQGVAWIKELLRVFKKMKAVSKSVVS